MTISADIIADSKHPNGSRLTTFVLKYPRFIHSELLTHRALSRNASSSRAIPVAKFVAWAREEPAMPEVWYKNKAGMQGTELMSPEEVAKCQEIILGMRDFCILGVERLAELGLHKQTANRYLEPWHHITVVVSATDWANFFALRYHHMAQPEFRILARRMLQHYVASQPRRLQFGDWHLPFISSVETKAIGVEQALKSSVARTARVSYNNHDGTAPNIEKDAKLHDDLVVQKPLHASPAEHQAQALDDVTSPVGDIAKLRGNFALGWGQYRKTLVDENVLHRPSLTAEDLEGVPYDLYERRARDDERAA